MSQFQLSSISTMYDVSFLHFWFLLELYLFNLFAFDLDINCITDKFDYFKLSFRSLILFLFYIFNSHLKQISEMTVSSIYFNNSKLDVSFLIRWIRQTHQQLQRIIITRFKHITRETFITINCLALSYWSQWYLRDPQSYVYLSFIVWIFPRFACFCCRFFNSIRCFTTNVQLSQNMFFI